MAVAACARACEGLSHALVVRTRLNGVLPIQHVRATRGAAVGGLRLSACVCVCLCLFAIEYTSADRMQDVRARRANALWGSYDALSVHERTRF